MAICDKCKKTPLEYREVNNVRKGDREVVLCDDCYAEAFRQRDSEQ
jgi:predicted SprT family Zn-dependent metalloprotease